MSAVELPVTIVIPAFKPRFLAEAIDSVLAQDHEPLELIVIDDSGGDRVAPVVTPYAEREPERVRFIRQHNQGQALALNRGFAEARGELVGHLGDDDVLLPGAIRALAGAADASPEAVASYSSWHVIDDMGRTVDTITPIDYSLAESVRLHDTIVGPAAVVRRGPLARSGGWDPAFRWLADFEFLTRLAMLGPMTRVTEPLAGWRAHEASLTISETGAERAREHVRLLDAIYAREDLPAAVAQVRGEAFRNAYAVAASFVGEGLNSVGERFLVVDTMAPRVSAAASERRNRASKEPEAPGTELLRRLADCEREIGRLRSAVDERRAARARARARTG